MPWLKKILKIFLRILIFIVLFLIIYFLASWICPYIKVNRDYVQEKQGIEIFIKSNGVHTDIVMPVKSKLCNWSTFLPFQDFEQVDEQFEYIAVGWGDKGFYLNTPEWKDLKFSTAFNAAFGLSETAMHITYNYSKPKPSESCKKIILSEKQYQKLIVFILNSFYIKDKKPIKIMHPGYSVYDCFYEAKGTYHLFKTCNVWTGNALSKTGVKIGIWTPFQGGIINHL